MRMIVVALLLVLPMSVHAADGPRKYFRKPDAWFKTDEARQAAANILSYQTDRGDWPKNLDTSAQLYTGNRSELKGTFDNGATTDELRFLARIYEATHEERYRQAFDKGLIQILHAQYSNGGWPQSYPPGKGYARYITFNDNAMVRLMEFVREVYREELYRFVPAERRQDAQQAFDRGVQCILRCQIKVDGTLTAWCAQHDEKDLSPRPARTYELTSLSGSESVGVVRLLMSLEHPSREVVQAVDGAVAWFRAAALKGIRVEMRPDPKAPRGRDKVVVKDPEAPPIWARFYEIGANRPIFSDRDGVAKRELSEIGYERRNGYAWLGYWPRKLLDEEFPAWKKKVAAGK